MQPGQTIGAVFDFEVLDVGWHVGSPSQRKHGNNFNPELTYRRMNDAFSSTLSNVRGTTTNLRVCGNSCTFKSAKKGFVSACFDRLDVLEAVPAKVALRV